MAEKPDSHDICFIADGDTRRFLADRLGEEPGDVVDARTGAVVGSHSGAYAYTVGQRKGLRLEHPAADGRPRYVLSITPTTNTVTVGPAEALEVTEVGAERPVWTGGDRPVGPIDCEVQLRAHGDVVPATVRVDGDRFQARLHRPLRGVAAGQAIVAYRPDPAGDIVLGSATITNQPGSGPPVRPAPPDRASRTGSARRSASLPLVSDQSWPWPAGAATGIGSLPGTDIAEAQRIVLGELPALPHLPELPARGPGAELIGRTAGLLVELPVELYAARWRIAGHPGRDLRRTRDLLERDLDQLTEQAEAYVGPLKISAGGPFTLAANLDLPIGGRMLRDPGAVRDLTASLAEGLRRHVADLRRRLPGAQVLLQLDEPALPAVLAGRVPTESGFSAYRPVESTAAAEALRAVVDSVEAPVVVHCCAPDVPLELIRSTGAVAVALDLAQVTQLDPLGEAIDAGLGLLAGAVPALPPPGGQAPTSAQAADRVRQLWDRLGFPRAQLAAQVVVTPTCGLAGATPAYARAVLAACRDAGRRLHGD